MVKPIAPKNLPRMSERAFQFTVIEAGQLLGWLVLHFPQMIGNPKGFPDLLFLKNDRYILAELKVTKGGVVSENQKRFHENAALYGVTVHIWWNTDEDWQRLVAILDDEGKVGQTW